MGRESEEEAPQQAAWESLWSSGVPAGYAFDASSALPELVRQVKLGLLPAGECALVPGCGRAYDVGLLSRSGLFRRVVGIDVSGSAVRAARDYLRAQTPPLPDNWEVRREDAFAAGGAYDLVYDYTFFCAVPAGLRGRWGAQMGALVRRGGLLVTVMFPMGGAGGGGGAAAVAEAFDGELGPPRSVSVRDYAAVLRGFEAVDGPRRLRDGAAHAGRGGGLTWWCAWRRV